ncbi:NBR1-Ig-like domain-containing protein [Actinocorallia herbida]|uniref:NBR1-Ig-like domain-containing protein n=1 Tax=Actinocorallia herbida TaxID=58109 RepID=UPI000F4C69CD|nr:NBR1-Ig-like domain-containing protein [Actinocorallia herbida]
MCGGDPAAYRDRWERANRTVRGSNAPGAAVPAGGSEARQTAEPDASTRPPPEERTGDPRPGPAGRPGRGRPRLSVLTKAALATTAAGSVVAVVIALSADRGVGSDQQGAQPLSGPAETVPGPEDCPVLTPNPPPAPPAHPGDLAVFVADVTLTDCARVAPGDTLTKTWRLQNAGTVPWTGYSLQRLDSPQQVGRCQTIAESPIADTPPGATVDVSTAVIAQKAPGLCYMLFKLVDAEGRIAFPATRPVNFQIIIDPRAPAARDPAEAGRRALRSPARSPSGNS